jgi:hypothetical protein
MLFHRHKYSEIKEDGYQYCLKCGNAIVPPCIHEWKLIQDLKIEGWGRQLVTGKEGPFFIRSYECSKCTEFKNEYVE